MNEFLQDQIQNQEYSLTTIKGIITKNINYRTTNSVECELNKYLDAKADDFVNIVAKPLKDQGIFDGNKTLWYYNIYKEGIEANKLQNNPFKFVQVNENAVNKIVKYLQHKDILEYCELGTSFLSNCFMILSSWYRDSLVLERLETIYASNNPVDWIIAAINNEKLLETSTSRFPEIIKIIGKIQLIVGKRA